MTCAELDALLCDYVDGTLYGEAKATVETHLGECPTCAQLVRDMRAAVAFVEKAEPVEPPPELITRLLFLAPTGKQHRQGGLRGFLSRLLEPVLQPRLAMGMAMTILSFSLVAKFAGIETRQISPSDLHPVAIWHEVSDRFYQSYDSVVKYYRSLQVVYEIQTRLGEWGAGGEEPVAGKPDPPKEDEIGVLPDSGGKNKDGERSEAE